MKRGFSSVEDDSPTANQQSTKYSKNPNNGRKLTFQLNDSLRDAYGSPSVDCKIKTHQSTPYPKLRQLQDEDDHEISALAVRPSATRSTAETVEKRNPEFLNKICSLNRSFIRWIDIYFNKGDNFDFTPVCNDYIRFMNNLKEKYPDESGHLSVNDKPAAGSNCLGDSSPTKNKLTFYNATRENLHTPPPNPGDPGYKSTPHPKNLLKQQQTAAASESVPKFGSFAGKLQGEEENNAVRQQKPTAKFEFLPQQQTTEDKKDAKFSFFSAGTSSLSAPKEFTGNQIGSNAISKNLFDIKPRLSNNSPLQLSPAKDAAGAMPAPKPTDNHFSADSIFKAQLNQSVSKLADLTDPNLTANATINLTANDTVNDDENYVPPMPESVAHVEEDAKYSVKCKLFLKKEDHYIEKGIGTLYVKVTNDSGNQLLIRADNSLGTILLNTRLKKSLPIITTKSGILLTIPNFSSSPNKSKEPEPETASYYIKVKSHEIRDELSSHIKNYSI